MSAFYKIDGDFLYLNIKVVPKASKDELCEINGGKLKIRVTAAPQGGKANDELRAFLSKILKVPKHDIVIASGEKSRIKTLKLPASASGFFETIDAKKINN